MEELEQKIAKLLSEGLAKSREEAEVKAKQIIADEIKAAKDLADAELKTVKDELASFKVTFDQKDKEVQEALTQMNRIKTRDNQDRAKSLTNVIYEALEEKSDKLKEYNKSKVSTGIELKVVGSMSVPSGSVAPEYLAPRGLAHELVHARNAIPVFQTSQTSIKYTQFSSKDGDIATVAAGAAKPQLDYTPTVKTAEVYKVAGYMRVHDEFLEDLVGARQWIAYELPQRLFDVEDQKIFKGSGSNDILGLYTQATALSYYQGVTAASNAWDKLANMLAQVRVAKRASNAIWVSPQDYMELLINKGNTLEYTYPMSIANNNGQLYLGGVPIYQHTVFNQNEALVGDFATGTAIFQRTEANIQFSTEDATNFTTNQTTVRIEERFALPIFVPEAFVKGDLSGFGS